MPQQAGHTCPRGRQQPTLAGTETPTQHCHQLPWCASPSRSGQGLRGVNTIPAAKWNEQVLIQLTSISPKINTIPPAPATRRIRDAVLSSLAQLPAATSRTPQRRRRQAAKGHPGAELLSSVLVHPLYLSCRSLLHALTKCLQIHHEHLVHHLPATRRETCSAWPKLPPAWFTTSGVQSQQQLAEYAMFLALLTAQAGTWSSVLG